MQTRSLLLAFASLSVATAAPAQVIDPTPRDDLLFYQLQTQVVFGGPVLVVLVPLPVEGSPLDDTPEMNAWRDSVHAVVDSARSVAERFGFTVVARDPDHATISSLKGDAYFSAPRNTTTGYILIAPLKRPRLQRGYLSSDGLADLLSEYQSPNRPLAL